MPAIGTLSFANDDGLDSGVAMLHAKPPDCEIAVNYNDCQLLASPDSPYVVCRFAGACSLADAYNQGSSLVQEALDVLSMTGRADLVTREAEDEHLVWWAASGTRSIALLSTASFPVKVGPVSLTVRDAQGNVVPPTPTIPTHHIGFRFYRLSQASDDLYDAYRNMYLAFELLLSSSYPKTQQREIDWLRQSLTSASTDLALSELVPAGTCDSVAQVIRVIYHNARLPLFHAKDGKAYFAPVHSAAQREAVVSALRMLTHIVTRMADKWFSTRRFSGLVNLDMFEQQIRSVFSGSCFVLTDNPTFKLDDDLDSESIANGIPFSATFSETHGAGRPYITGMVPVSTLTSRGRLRALYLVNDKSLLISFSPDTTVDLNGFDEFEIRLFIRCQNASAPKYIYSR